MFNVKFDMNKLISSVATVAALVGCDYKPSEELDALPISSSHSVQGVNKIVVEGHEYLLYCWHRAGGIYHSASCSFCEINLGQPNERKDSKCPLRNKVEKEGE